MENLRRDKQESEYDELRSEIFSTLSKKRN
jgi:hypothetical protein